MTVMSSIADQMPDFAAFFRKISAKQHSAAQIPKT